jgi:hypothetical protein
MNLDIQIIDGGGAYVFTPFSEEGEKWINRHPTCKSGEMDTFKITYLERKMLQNGLNVEVIVVRRDCNNEVTISQGKLKLEDKDIYIIPKEVN